MALVTLFALILVALHHINNEKKIVSSKHHQDSFKPFKRFFDHDEDPFEGYFDRLHYSSTTDPDPSLSEPTPMS